MSFNTYSNGIAHIGIPTSNLQKTIDFYLSLGFNIAHQNTVPSTGAGVAFLQLGNLMIETYAEGGNGLDGAINHFALNCSDIHAAYDSAVANKMTILSNGIESLPFWENGVSFFIIEGPNQERIELCQRF